MAQACSSEVMMLRMARKYDYNTNSIVYANNQPYTKDSYIRAGQGETIDDMLRFCRQMWKMKVDNAEYALLTAIVIFSGKQPAPGFRFGYRGSACDRPPARPPFWLRVSRDPVIWSTNACHSVNRRACFGLNRDQSWAMFRCVHPFDEPDLIRDMLLVWVSRVVHRDVHLIEMISTVGGVGMVY